MAVARGFLITVGGVQLQFFPRKIVVSLCLDCLIGIVIFCLKLIHNHKSTSRGFLDFSIGIRAGRSILFYKKSIRARSCLICDNGYNS